MADLLCVGTCATNDPTKASLPFVTANGALSNGTDVAVALIGDAALLMKDEIADSVLPVGFPPLTELMAKVREGNVPIYV